MSELFKNNVRDPRSQDPDFLELCLLLVKKYQMAINLTLVTVQSEVLVCEQSELALRARKHTELSCDTQLLLQIYTNLLKVF